MSSAQASNSLWLNIDSKVILENQTANPNMQIPTTPGDYSFKLLMPDNFSISVAHTYEPYDSISARLAETIAKWYKLGTQISGIAKEASNNVSAGGSIKGALEKFRSGSLWNEQVVNTRVDAPLVYKNSQNLQYNLNFTYVAHMPGDSTILFEISRALMKCSSPKRDTGAENVFIKPPNLFKVYTNYSGSGVPPMLNLEYAALVSVQPTYHGPYIDGTPLKLELQLTFTDVTPLFSTTFDYSGTSVTTGEIGGPLSAEQTRRMGVGPVIP